MSKDTISVNINVYDIPIVVEQLKKLEQENKQLKEQINEYQKAVDETTSEKIDLQQENKQLKEELEKKNKMYWQKQCAYYSSILYSLEKWLNKEKGYYLYGRTNGKTLLYGKELKRIETIEKIKELKEKYK